MATDIQIVIDCADADRLARFWADAVEDGEYWVVMQDPERNEFCVQ